jgi:hypothetical protein
MERVGASRQHWPTMGGGGRSRALTHSGCIDAYCTYFLYLSIELHASIFVRIVGNPVCHTFP